MKWMALFLGASWATAIGAGQIVRFEPGEVDFGTQGQGVHLEAEVKLTNTTQEEIHLLNVTSDCSCTAGEPRQRRLRPGESTLMPVGLDTRTYQGPLLRRLTVNTSAGDAELRIKVNIRPFAHWTITPMPVTLPTSQRRQEVTSRLTVVHDGPGRGPFAVLEAKSDQPWLQAQLSTAGAQQSVELRKLTTAPIGAHLVQVTLRTNDPDQPVLPLKVVVSVVSPVRVSPNPIVLPVTQVGLTASRLVVVSGWEESSEPRASLASGRVEPLGRQPNGDHHFSIFVTPQKPGVQNFALQFAVDEDHVLLTVPVIIKADATR